MLLSLNGDEYMKKFFYISTESLTSAMRGYRILNRKGISARVEKTVMTASRRGCGFAIVIYNEPQKALKILEENNIRVLSVKER